jgi:hypothetical protein
MLPRSPFGFSLPCLAGRYALGQGEPELASVGGGLHAQFPAIILRTERERRNGILQVEHQSVCAPQIGFFHKTGVVDRKDQRGSADYPFPRLPSCFT